MTSSTIDKVNPSSPAQRLSRQERGWVALLAAMNFIEITDALLMTPLAEPLQTSLPMDVREFSVTFAAYGLSAATCGLIGSIFVDRFDRRRMVLAAFAGLLLSIVFSALAQSFESLLFARTLAGAFGGLTTCTTLAILSDLIPETRRGAAIGGLQTSFALAAVAGLPLCIGLGMVTHPTRGPFAGVVFLGAAVWLVVWRYLPSVKGHMKALDGRTSSVRRTLSDFLVILTDVRHARALAFMLFTGLGTYLVIPFMAQYLELNVGVDRASFSFVFLAMGLASLVMALLSGRATDAWGPPRVFVAMVCGTMTLVAIIVHLPPVPIIVAALVASCFMAVAVGRLVPTHAIMLATPKPQVRGAFATLYNSVSLLSTSVGPMLGGLIVTVDTSERRLHNFPEAGLAAIACHLVALALLPWMRAKRTAE